MKTTLENAAISFRVALNDLKAITGKNNKEVAELIGCSAQTISNAYNDPLSASGRIILLIQEHLKKEERKRYE